MKKYLIATLGLSAAALFGMSSFTANAAEEADAASSEAKTQGTMTFKIDDSEVTPETPNVVRPNIPDETFPEDDLKPDNPDAPGQGGTGKKSFYINFAPNLVFKDIEILGTDMTKGVEPLTFGPRGETNVPYAPFVQVTDNRGVGDGWVLKLSSTVFKNKELEELKGVTLNFKPNAQENLMLAMNGQAESLAPVGLPNDTILQVGSTDEFIMMNAAKGTGIGTWTYSLGGRAANPDVSSSENSYAGLTSFNPETPGVEVMIPASSLPKVQSAYTSDLTWTLSADPT